MMMPKKPKSKEYRFPGPWNRFLRIESLGKGTGHRSWAEIKAMLVSAPECLQTHCALSWCKQEGYFLFRETSPASP